MKIMNYLLIPQNNYESIRINDKLITESRSFAIKYYIAKP